MNEAELYDRAVKTYFARCDKAGTIPQKPDSSLSGVKGGQVVLKNTNGELARFNMWKNGDMSFAE